MHARSLLGGFTQLVIGVDVGAQSDGRRKRVCVGKLHDGFLPEHHTEGTSSKGVELYLDCVVHVVQNEPNWPGSDALTKNMIVKNATSSLLVLTELTPIQYTALWDTFSHKSKSFVKKYGIKFIK